MRSEEKVQKNQGKSLENTKILLTNEMAWCKMEIHTVGVCEFLTLNICHKYSTTDMGGCQEQTGNNLTTAPGVSKKASNT